MHALLSFATAATLVLLLAVPATAPDRDGLMGDLLKDITEVEDQGCGSREGPARRHLQLASDGRAVDGARSSRMSPPTTTSCRRNGHAPPSETGINGKTSRRRPRSRNAR